MFPNLIIASSQKQGEYVANWMSKYESGPRWDGNFGACPPTDVTPLERIAWTSIDSAVVHIERLQPIRIIIVDYVRWKPAAPGEVAFVWNLIQGIRNEHGVEVIWW